MTAGLGAAVGTAILLVAPADSFRAIVPYLVLAACALLAFQPALTRAAGRHRTEHPGVPLHAGTFAAGVYGGYFGGALGSCCSPCSARCSPTDCSGSTRSRACSA